MKINATTKIATLLKHGPRALEAIVRISPKFIKLRNPLLRRLLARRTTIAMASKIGGCEVTDFFEQLKPLGFEVEETVQEDNTQGKLPPPWLLTIAQKDIEELDVRPLLDAGKDPLKQILDALRMLPNEHVLKIVNTFEPSPLIAMAEKKGFTSYSEAAAEDLFFTYFSKVSEAEVETEEDSFQEGEDWEELSERFRCGLVNIDVRDLPMPQPMLRILEALETLTAGQALFVEHKKIPVFLLPELRERGFDYRIKEMEDQNVQLLIFKG
ncbi:MAG TPA: DUF2249 domain-containing protein [Cyclobacteriaceae bacterium]|nr:DUF2249 domain-containing protein [Cyclobacteriaceae bacterium]